MMGNKSIENIQLNLSHLSDIMNDLPKSKRKPIVSSLFIRIIPFGNEVIENLRRKTANISSIIAERENTKKKIQEDIKQDKKDDVFYVDDECCKELIQLAENKVPIIGRFIENERKEM